MENLVAIFLVSKCDDILVTWSKEIASSPEAVFNSLAREGDSQRRIRRVYNCWERLFGQ